jgi:acetoin utilization deacetylase AcuC-like enzyme
MHERGDGDGAGYALNVPLPPGTGDGGYLHVMDEVVVPAVRAFAPDLVLVSCGFDAGVMDPLARQMVTSAGFRAMTERLLAVAADTCAGRVVMSHEGGYNAVYVPFCGLAVLETMSGVQVLDDPFLELVSGFAGQGLKPAEAEVIAVAAGQIPVAGGS